MARRKSVPEPARLKKRRQNDIKLDRKILLLQNSDIPMIPKLPFSRLVREIMQQQKETYRLSVVALDALQEACEFYLTHLFSDAYLLTYHRRRVTLDRSDIRMVLHIREGSFK
ncbi:hypothetical protein HA402_011909 [Bradysia odoriphaga]|nr:hypothetical protein HA402_011909 [Bradysia odoriphaga]